MNNISWESYHIPDFELDVHGPNEFDEDYDEESDYEMSKLKNKLGKLPRIVPTPFGLCRADDKMNPLRRFNFWFGHTNFRLTNKVKRILDNVPGVEMMEINTPYRFIIAVAQMFNPTEVKMNIEHILCGKHKLEACLQTIENVELRKLVKDECDKLKSFQYWTLYLFPNGKIYSNHYNNQQEYIKGKNELITANRLSCGVLISSEDVHETQSNNPI